MKIYTGCFDYCKGPKCVSISSDAAKEAKFDGPVISGLRHQKKWDKGESLDNYAERYYETTLKAKTPSEILMQLDEGAILLSSEKPNEFSPRQIVAAWLELYYGMTIREVVCLDGGKVKLLPYNKYYAPIKLTLETLIRRDMDMHGYSSIAAAYAYEQAQKLKDKKEVCDSEGISELVYMNLAEVLEKKYDSGQKKM